jgi:hypothetical protein
MEQVLPLLFPKKRLSERELTVRAGEQLREHGVNAPARCAVTADRCLQQGRIEEANRWRAVSERLREMLAAA